MSLLRIFDIAGSAMSAQSTLLNTTASNLANSESVSSSANNIYKEREPIFAAALEKARRDAYEQAPEVAPVQVVGITEINRPAIKEYSPGHPLADDQGYIYKPNINVMEQMTNSILASRGYQINADIAESTKELLNKTISLGQNI